MMAKQVANANLSLSPKLPVHPRYAKQTDAAFDNESDDEGSYDIGVAERTEFSDDESSNVSDEFDRLCHNEELSRTNTEIYDASFVVDSDSCDEESREKFSNVYRRTRASADKMVLNSSDEDMSSFADSTPNELRKTRETEPEVSEHAESHCSEDSPAAAYSDRSNVYRYCSEFDQEHDVDDDSSSDISGNGSSNRGASYILPADRSIAAARFDNASHQAYSDRVTVNNLAKLRELTSIATVKKSAEKSPRGGRVDKVVVSNDGLRRSLIDSDYNDCHDTLPTACTGWAQIPDRSSSAIEGGGRRRRKSFTDERDEWPNRTEFTRLYKERRSSSHEAPQERFHLSSDNEGHGSGVYSTGTGRCADGKRRKKRAARQEREVVKAESIPGHCGNKDIDELLNFIENSPENALSNSSKKGCSNGGGVTVTTKPAAKKAAVDNHSKVTQLAGTNSSKSSAKGKRENNIGTEKESMAVAERRADSGKNLASFLTETMGSAETKSEDQSHSLSTDGNLDTEKIGSPKLKVDKLPAEDATALVKDDIMSPSNALTEEKLLPSEEKLVDDGCSNCASAGTSSVADNQSMLTFEGDLNDVECDVASILSHVTDSSSMPLSSEDGDKFTIVAASKKKKKADKSAFSRVSLPMTSRTQHYMHYSPNPPPEAHRSVTPPPDSFSVRAERFQHPSAFPSLTRSRQLSGSEGNVNFDAEDAVACHNPCQDAVKKSFAMIAADDVSACNAAADRVGRQRPAAVIKTSAESQLVVANKLGQQPVPSADVINQHVTSVTSSATQHGPYVADNNTTRLSSAVVASNRSSTADTSAQHQPGALDLSAQLRLAAVDKLTVQPRAETALPKATVQQLSKSTLSDAPKQTCDSLVAQLKGLTASKDSLAFFDVATALDTVTNSQHVSSAVREGKTSALSAPSALVGVTETKRGTSQRNTMTSSLPGAGSGTSSALSSTPGPIESKDRITSANVIQTSTLPSGSPKNKVHTSVSSATESRTVNSVNVPISHASTSKPSSLSSNSEGAVVFLDGRKHADDIDVEFGFEIRPSLLELAADVNGYTQHASPQKMSADSMLGAGQSRCSDNHSLRHTQSPTTSASNSEAAVPSVPNRFLISDEASTFNYTQVIGHLRREWLRALQRSNAVTGS